MSRQYLKIQGSYRQVFEALQLEGDLTRTYDRQSLLGQLQQDFQRSFRYVSDLPLLSFMKRLFEQAPDSYQQGCFDGSLFAESLIRAAAIFKDFEQDEAAFSFLGKNRGTVHLCPIAFTTSKEQPNALAFGYLLNAKDLASKLRKPKKYPIILQMENTVGKPDEIQISLYMAPELALRKAADGKIIDLAKQNSKIAFQAIPGKILRQELKQYCKQYANIASLLEGILDQSDNIDSEKFKKNLRDFDGGRAFLQKDIKLSLIKAYVEVAEQKGEFSPQEIQALKEEIRKNIELPLKKDSKTLRNSWTKKRQEAFGLILKAKRQQVQSTRPNHYSNYVLGLFSLSSLSLAGLFCMALINPIFLPIALKITAGLIQIKLAAIVSAVSSFISASIAGLREWLANMDIRRRIKPLEQSLAAVTLEDQAELQEKMIERAVSEYSSASESERGSVIGRSHSQLSMVSTSTASPGLQSGSEAEAIPGLIASH